MAIHQQLLSVGLCLHYTLAAAISQSHSLHLEVAVALQRYLVDTFVQGQRCRPAIKRPKGLLRLRRLVLGGLEGDGQLLLAVRARNPLDRLVLGVAHL